MTQAIRAQSNNSDAVNDIIRRRDEIQENASLNEAALKAVENKPEVMRGQSKNIEKLFGSSASQLLTSKEKWIAHVRSTIN
uniref:Uncharacterized protein n=1 Tax=Escherichia coli TaxID=562 RepID=A0A6D1NZT0_ECOLX|nr:hypothetical protein [Escherichia coli]QHJ90679.1 hypothetical protein [Escherichia coli]